MIDLNKRISKNFTWGEAFKSQLSEENNIDNTTEDPIILGNIERTTLKIAQPIRDFAGEPLIISSFFRSEPLEKLLYPQRARQKDWNNYFARKQHPKGEAIDIQATSTKTLQDMLNFVKNNLEFDQLILEGNSYTKWLHISLRQENNRKEDFTILV